MCRQCSKQTIDPISCLLQLTLVQLLQTAPFFTSQQLPPKPVQKQHQTLICPTCTRDTAKIAPYLCCTRSNPDHSFANQQLLGKALQHQNNPPPWTTCSRVTLRPDTPQPNPPLLFRLPSGTHRRCSVSPAKPTIAIPSALTPATAPLHLLQAGPFFY